jgi:hypothetical protein
MRRGLGAFLAVMMALGMVACSGAAQGGTTRSASASSPVPGEAGAPTEPGIMQLLVGTFELEEGDLAVSAEQAAELLPLWKAYAALGSDDSAVAMELEALVTQIQETMTAEQNRAIADMQLTAEDMAGVMQELGISATGAARSRDTEGSGSTAGGLARGGFGGGGFPGGGAPGGGGAMPGGGMPGGGMPEGGMPAGAFPGGEETTGGGAQVTRMQGMLLNPLIEALVELLESKV